MTQPDLFVVNSMDASSHAVLQPTAAAISLRNDGRVTVTSLSRFKFSCPLDLKWAPSDAHNCSISIGTMSQSYLMVQLGLDAIPARIGSAIFTSAPHRNALSMYHDEFDAVSVPQWQLRPAQSVVVTPRTAAGGARKTSGPTRSDVVRIGFTLTLTVAWVR